MAGTIGKPYRFFYTAKNYERDIMTLTAKVRKPGGNYAGQFPLMEVMDDSFFRGMYFFDFITSQADTIGDYVISIKDSRNPLDSTISKFEMVREISDSSFVDLIGTVDDETILRGIVGKIDVELSGVVRGRIIENSINGVIIYE